MTLIMAKTYIAKAKEKAADLLRSPICGNSDDDKDINRAIEYVQGLRFYDNEDRQIKFWARVLKELKKHK